MNLKEAIKILKTHNEWRRGADVEMCNPTELGIAIDVVVNYDFQTEVEKLKDFMTQELAAKNDECDHYFPMNNQYKLMPCWFCGEIKV